MTANLFIDNYASLYGPDISSYPVSMAIISEDQARGLTDLSLPQRSGGSLSFYVGLVDDGGQIVGASSGDLL